MRTSRLFIVTALLLFAFSAATQAQYPPAASKQAAPKAEEVGPLEVKWLAYSEGIKKAETESKPVVIDFTASWCGWCKKMERDTFSDSSVIAYMNENFVPIKVWGDANTPVTHQGEHMTEKDLARIYGVRGYPTFWFLEADGGRIGPTSGYKTVAQFLPLIQYIAGSHYKSMSYESFLKKQDG